MLNGDLSILSGRGSDERSVLEFQNQSGRINQANSGAHQRTQIRREQAMSQSIREMDSLDNFTPDPSRFLKKLRQKGEPMLLTVEGTPGIVVQDAASYQ